MALARLRFDVVGLLTAAGALALAAMLLWTVTDISLRLALNSPLHGVIDIVESALVLVAFLALPQCFERDEQIKVDIFDHVVSPFVLSMLRLLGELATLAFLVLLAVTVLQPLADAYRFGDMKADVRIPIFVLLAAIEAALVVSSLVVLVRVVSQVRAIVRPRTAATGDGPLQ
jgi:TRAP-type C4-dicarboxylate transport system permease small subunit